MTETVIDGIDYGPLACLIGVWKGDEGINVSPEPDGDECDPYFETITFKAVGDVTNAKAQVLSIVRYHQVVSRKSDGEVFHDQIGYWLWDPATEVVVQTLTIPRAVTLLAGGKARMEGDTTILEVCSRDGDAEWDIVQSPFLKKNARTLEFTHTVSVSGDTMRYSETMLLDIYGKHSYKHTDSNTLKQYNQGIEY